jgi:hypothetical protein
VTRPPTSRNGDRAVLLALSLGACGPYAELAQKLDVTVRIVGDTWIAAGPDRAVETRVLLVGKGDGSGVAPFAFTSIAADCLTLQGTWSEDEPSGVTTLQVAHTYTMPGSTGTSTAGSQRDDTPYTTQVTVTRGGRRLLVAGDSRIVGTYVLLSDVIARLGTTTQRDAACAYQVASLSIQSSEIRIIGFGGNQMTQYLSPATYVGTIDGSVRVSLTHSMTDATFAVTLEYRGFEDEGGVRLTGAQRTSTSFGGDGHMSGSLGFAIAPTFPDPSGVTTLISGGIDYSAITLSNGSTSGGSYHVTIDGGGTADVPSVGTQSPNVADCLNLL